MIEEPVMKMPLSEGSRRQPHNDKLGVEIDEIVPRCPHDRETYAKPYPQICPGIWRDGFKKPANLSSNEDKYGLSPRFKNGHGLTLNASPSPLNSISIAHISYYLMNHWAKLKD